MLAAAIDVGEQLLRVERLRIDGEQLEVCANRRRFDIVVPTLQVLAPEPLVEHGPARPQPPPYFGVAPGDLLPNLLRRMTDRFLGRADRSRAVIGKAVDKRKLEVLEERPVATEALAEAAPEGVGEDLGMEAR